MNLVCYCWTCVANFKHILYCYEIPRRLFEIQINVIINSIFQLEVLPNKTINITRIYYHKILFILSNFSKNFWNKNYLLISVLYWYVSQASWRNKSSWKRYNLYFVVIILWFNCELMSGLISKIKVIRIVVYTKMCVLW